MAIKLPSNNSASNGSSVVMPPAATASNGEKGVWTWGMIPQKKYFVLRTTISPKGLAENLSLRGSKDGGKFANVHNGSLLWGTQYRQDGGVDYTVRVNILPMVRKDGVTVFNEKGLPKFVESSQGINLSANKGFDIEELDATSKAAIEAALGGMKLEAALQIEALRNTIMGMVSSMNAEKRLDTKEWLKVLLKVKTDDKLVPSQLKVILPRSLEFSEAFTEEVLERIADENKSAVLEIYIPLVAEAQNKDMKPAKVSVNGAVCDVLDPEGEVVKEAQFTWGTQNIPIEGIVVKFGKSLGGVDTSRMYSNEYVTKSIRDIWAIQTRTWIGAEVSLAEERIEGFFSRYSGNKWHLNVGLLPWNGEETCEYWEASSDEVAVWNKYMAKSIGSKKKPFEWEGKKIEFFTQQMMEVLIACREQRSRAPWEQYCVGCAINKPRLGSLVPSTPVEEEEEEVIMKVEVQSVVTEEPTPEVTTPTVEEETKEVIPVVENEFVDELEEESCSMDDFMSSFDDLM